MEECTSDFEPQHEAQAFWQKRNINF